MGDLQARTFLVASIIYNFVFYLIYELSLLSPTEVSDAL
jgi:hypothetical protein